MATLIPLDKIRFRYNSSRQNLVALLPFLTELWIHDNTDEAQRPAEAKPKLLLYMQSGTVGYAIPADEVPGWAKPIFYKAAT